MKLLTSKVPVPYLHQIYQSKIVSMKMFSFKANALWSSKLFWKFEVQTGRQNKAVDRRAKRKRCLRALWTGRLFGCLEKLAKKFRLKKG